MSERKVLNKYIPPNFDPSLIPKTKLPKDRQHVVRLMAPFSMRCNTCHEYIYKGRKFNARKETVAGEKYLTFNIYRFYIRCPMCASEITFKTDPEHEDYTCEHGAKRNFEPWRQEQTEIEEIKRKRIEEEEENPIKALENRTADSKKEIEILDALDEIRAINAMHQQIDTDELLRTISNRHSQNKDIEDQKQELDDEDEKLVRQYFPISDTNIMQSKISPSIKLPITQSKKKTSFDIGIITKRNNK